MFDGGKGISESVAGQAGWRPDPAWDQYSNATGSVLPEGLETMAPGPELASVLAGIDPSSLSGYDRITVMKARQRLRSQLDAELAADMVGVVDAVSRVVEEEEAYQAAASEIRAALRLTRRAADSWLHVSTELLSRLPSVWEAMHRGEIDLPRARVIIDQTLVLDRASATEVAELILPEAADLTTGQLRARLARLVIGVNPEAAKKRFEDRLLERRLYGEPTPEGTANLHGLDLDPVDTTQAMRRINRMAQALKNQGDPRTLDQIRADIFLDLLCGRPENSPVSPPRAVVDVRVNASTLAGLDESPGEIPGWGPVLADVARKLVSRQPNATWQVTVTDETGRPLNSVTTRRRPTAQQKRMAVARSDTCVFPGCRMPATESDLDHNQPWAETHVTETDQLAPLCRHDHVNRHQRGWKISQLAPGAYQLTSPLGHIYTTGADPP
jgi:hypothetical protein